MPRVRYCEVARNAQFRYLGRTLEKLTDYCAIDRKDRRYWSLRPSDMVEVESSCAVVVPRPGGADDWGAGFYGWATDDDEVTEHE